MADMNLSHGDTGSIRELPGAGRTIYRKEEASAMKGKNLVRSLMMTVLMAGLTAAWTGGGSNGTASAIIRSTSCAAAGTSAMSPTPQPAYMAMAATSPVVNTVGG
jgi:hypothetical protein